MEYKKTGIEWLDNIDWEMLASQKRTLIRRQTGKIDDLWGIIHLIDAMQDYMNDNFIILENKTLKFPVGE